MCEARIPVVIVLRMGVNVCRYCEMGTVVIGKVESGKCQKGDLLLVMPNRVSYLLDADNMVRLIDGISSGVLDPFSFYANPV
jgi:translation elongation factor EF-1alpha